MKTKYCVSSKGGLGNCQGNYPIQEGQCCDFQGQVYASKDEANQCKCLTKGSQGTQTYSVHSGTWSAGWPADFVQPAAPPPPTKETLTCEATLDWNTGGRRLCACKGATGPKPCSGDPCNGHGACSGNNICTCFPGYSGNSCTPNIAPPVDTSCTVGATFNVATGDAPCAACATCTYGVQTACTATTDTICKGAPACAAGATFNVATGAAPCAGCAAAATCARGVQAACTATADTICKAAPGDCQTGSTFNAATGKNPCGACAGDATCAAGVKTACTPTADTVCKAACTAGSTFNKATGAEPCAACSADATCTYGVKTACTATTNTVCYSASENPCCPNPCGAHGQCNGAGVCTCTQGWAGKTCTENPCKAASCSGHGSCSGHKDGFVCKCTDAWAGKTCAVDPASKLDGGGGIVPPPAEATNTGTCTDQCGGGSTAGTLKPNCCPTGHLCYEKDAFWWSCKKPGLCTTAATGDPNDPVKYRTPWTCKVMGGKARRQLDSVEEEAPVRAPQHHQPSLTLRRLDATTATCANGKIVGVVCACNPGYEGGGIWASGPTYPACVEVNYCAAGAASGLGPCQNGGTCRPLAIRADRGIDAGLGYVCDCKCGFADFNCQTCTAGCLNEATGTGVHRVGTQGDDIVNAAPRPAGPGRWAPVGFALAATLVIPGDTAGKLGMLALGLLAALPGASAHNWMTSPARGNEAGENNGFNGFQKAPGPQRSTRVHAQVGVGQLFPIEWAAGHGFGSYTYFAVVKAQDEAKLKKHTIGLLDDYIKNAPASGQDYLKEHPVMHVSDVTHNHQLLSGGNVAASYHWIPSIAASKGKRPLVFRQGHFGANPQVKLKKWSAGQDMRVKYKSAKYPWIISAHRFLMKYDYAKDADATLIEIPKEEGAGKYIVAYQWSGYYDIIDVNVMTAPSTDVFGKAGDNPSGFDRTDHCEFIPYTPIYKVLGCLALSATNDAEKCNSLCKAGCDGIQVEATKLNAVVLGTGIYADAELPPECNAVKNSGDHVCYAVTQGIPVVGPAYRVSSDPEDPVFYNSCYTKASGWTFDQKCADCPTVTIEPGWSFGQRCISCTEMRTNAAPGSFVPKWTPLPEAGVCRACDGQG